MCLINPIKKVQQPAGDLDHRNFTDQQNIELYISKQNVEEPFKLTAIFCDSADIMV